MSNRESNDWQQIEAGKKAYVAENRELRLGKLAVLSGAVMGIGSIMSGYNALTAENPRDTAFYGIVSLILVSSGRVTYTSRYIHRLRASNIYSENREQIETYVGYLESEQKRAN